MTARVIKRLSVGLAIAVVVFAAAELALRLVLGPPPPPVRVARGETGEQQFVFVSGDQARLGRSMFTGGPRPFSLDAGGPRVAFLGGSSVYGGDVRFEERFSDVLGRMLGIETINLAAPAMDSFDVAQIAAELDPVELSAVVVYSGHNDFGNAYFTERYKGIAGGFRAYGRRALEHLQVYCRLRLLLEPVPRPRPPSRQPDALTPARRDAIADHFEANLRRARWTLARRGVPLVLVTPVSSLVWRPSRRDCGEAPDCPDALWTRAMALRDTDPDGALALLREARDLDWPSVRAPGVAAEAVRRVGREAGARLVDVERSFPREPGLDAPASWIFVDQLHFTVAGHAEMAAQIAPVLRDTLGLTAP